jgi:hypothetical protein
MNIHMFKRHNSTAVATPSSSRELGHRVESTFDYSTCHFVLTCTCASRYETNHIDEALEWSEMHRAMAPLADQLSA